MKKAFLDTNILIRYLTNDDPGKADRVARLLDEAATGRMLLVTTELVIAELVWVLESAYGLRKAQISPLVRGILATPSLEVVNSDLVARALELYEGKNVDFVDGYVAALMEKRGIEDLFSFDRKHISRISTIRRREPS